jgi:hypothetical protein
LDYREIEFESQEVETEDCTVETEDLEAEFEDCEAKTEFRHPGTPPTKRRKFQKSESSTSNSEALPAERNPKKARRKSATDDSDSEWSKSDKRFVYTLW